MKWIGYASVMALATLSLVAPRSPARAQDPASSAMSNQVKQVLSSFVVAVNSGNVIVASTMVSTKPDICAIHDGNITRGPSAISARFDQLMGRQGKYQFALGDLNVSNVSGLALATGPYVVRNRSGSVAGKGAVTFLLENQAKKDFLGHAGAPKWVITYINRCSHPGGAH